MSYGTYASAQYVEADVLSRPKEWLVPLLYEHLLARLHRAGAQITAGDMEGKAESLAKANEIVLELAGALDRENGGEFAERLYALYSFFTTQIVEIGRSLDQQQLQRLIELISGLHQAWVEAARLVAPRGGAPKVQASAA